MPYTLTSSTHPLGLGRYAAPEDAAAYVQALLLRGEELPPRLRLVELAPDDGLSLRASKAHADVLGSAASGLRACEQLAREGRLATAQAVAEAFRAVLAAAGLVEIAEVRGAAVVVVEEIKAAKREAPPEPEPDPRELEPMEPTEGLQG